MKIELYSDLHTEFCGIDLAIRPDTDVVVLAGDCFVGKSGFEWLSNFCQSIDIPVVFVPGNHEYYGSTIEEMNKFFDEVSISNLHILVDNSVKIDDVWFHGTTLWTDFRAHGPVAEFNCMFAVATEFGDFNEIKGMTPQKMQSMALRAQKFLSDALFSRPNEKNVVVSHFPPLIECRHYGIESNVYSPYFNNNLWEMILDVNTEAWIYGHNHYSDDFEYRTRLVSNQRGYQLKDTLSNTLESKQIEI